MQQTEILGHREHREKGEGWLHTVTFRTQSGAIVTLEDDTDVIFAYSDIEDAMLVSELAELWKAWGMGGSHFPSVEMPDEAGVIPWTDLPHRLVHEMPAEDFALST